MGMAQQTIEYEFKEPKKQFPITELKLEFNGSTLTKDKIKDLASSDSESNSELDLEALKEKFNQKTKQILSKKDDSESEEKVLEEVKIVEKPKIQRKDYKKQQSKAYYAYEKNNYHSKNLRKKKSNQKIQSFKD